MVFGSFIVGDAPKAPVISQSNQSIGIPRASLGFLNGQRRFTKPQFIKTEIVPVPSGTTLTVSTTSGALLGKIRTDIHNSILESLTFTLDKGDDCASFRLRLLDLPDFPIPPSSLLTFAVDGEAVFAGKIDYPAHEGTPDIYEFRGLGLRAAVKELTGEFISIASGGPDFSLWDVSDIVHYVVENFIAPYSSIIYSPNAIIQSGVAVINHMDFQNHSLDKVLNTLGDMAGANWGVNANRELYFIPRPKTGDSIQRTYFIGYDIQTFRPRLNLREVKNTIQVRRTEGKAAGGAGWLIAGTYSDLTSIAKYTKKELIYQILSSFGPEEADIIGNALLAEKKEPQLSARADGIPIRKRDDILGPGLYRFIMPFSSYTLSFSDVDDDAWTKGGAGDLTFAHDTNTFVHGNGALQISLENALGDTITATGSVIGRAEKIRFYIRSNTTGAFLRVGVGRTTAFEHTFGIDFPITDTFYNFDWDVTSENIDEINHFGIEVTENPGGPVEIYIDKIEIRLKGSKHYIMPLEKGTYTFSPTKTTAAIELGILPPRMDNFLAGLFATISELKYTTEIRE